MQLISMKEVISTSLWLLLLAALFYCISPTDEHLKCLGLLLDKSMLINKQDLDGQTALHVACKRSIENEKFILELLNHGANPNIYSVCYSCNSPLIYFRTMDMLY